MTLNKTESTLLYGSNLWYLSEGMLGPLFAVFAQRVGGDVLDIAWAWATYLLVNGALQIVVGKLADRWQAHKPIMIAGYALRAVGIFSYLFVHSSPQLFAVQAVIGLADAMANPTWCALYAQHENRKRGGFTWGLANGEALIMTGFAMFLGGLIVNNFSFTILFLTMGTVQVIATLYEATILRK